ncbi:MULTISPECIES: response regulator transcription factor [unclassified Streptomyces]|uniref:response regulator transcription factor n=1 Tax=unclassified Streptomyces TaxID=2593676 RepID=UPI000DB9FECE|nr:MULTISPECIES: response regulator transcription factor [unclassified Streptomyces]MYT73821.1 response regulator [Streptomyces sp. SID8367]RAJ89233.1 two-component system OmpR family response regulator [Streptomyces sp. PsTaAH-137]
MNAPEVPPGTRLLVVDDEPAILDVLATSLEFLGYEVDRAAAGLAALAAVREHAPHLVLLDVMLPDIDGFEVVRRLRQAGAATPVIFLTARESGQDIVGGLDLGADDYITKPFRLAEVAARVRAVLRRGESRAEPRLLVCGDVEMNTETYEVRRAGVLVDLSPTEYKLLRHLMLNRNRVLTHEQLLEHVWDFGEGDHGVLKTYISYLRRKLDALGPGLIETRRGIGYILRDQGSA